MDLFEQLKSEPLWFLLLLAICSFSILDSFFSILTRLYAKFHRPPTNLTRPTDSASTSASASSTTADSVAAATVYEVFLSFHGKDTRKGFTDHLYTSLVGAGIHTFRDNNELRVGKEICGELLDAIKESKISIPIFSQNYAHSKWCLRELEQMVKCHKNEGQKIFPIFYNVVPSDVRNQDGSYKLAFNLHKKKFDEDTIKRWRDALNMVGGLKGWELEKETDGHEGVFVKKVVEKVVIELEKNYKDLPTLVGMENHIKELMGLLEVDSDDVHIVGIHGMGGLGKTTMTKVIYNKMCNNFDAQCFLDNVREKSKGDDGLAEMQKRISSVSDGRNSGKKLLLVLDDIDDYIQVDRLMGELTRFGARSRIILTTRNKEVLDKIEVHCEDSFFVYKSYIPKFMDFSDSLQLFSKHAFKRYSPIDEFSALSKDVVSIAAGLPLVLVVLGSTFFGLKDKRSWEVNLKKLRRIPHKDVLKQLMFSFEALDETEKEIFLDIACFFIGHDKTRPTYMWESCELYPYLGINVLVSRSLITIDDKDRLQMHDQLRDLGRQIVREEGLQEKQSRLWCSKEALGVLELNQGTSCVKALRLEFDNAMVDAPNFPHLPNLRYLCMKNVRNVDGDFKDLPPNLRWLNYIEKWQKFSLRNMNMKNLVVLKLSASLGLTDDWDGWRQLEVANNLKVLDLSSCDSLHTLPNLSNLRKLVELDLSSCGKLTDIPNLSNLTKLVELNLSGCGNLTDIPNLSNLTKLVELNLSWCGNLTDIPNLSNLTKLVELNLSFCGNLTDIQGLQKLEVLQVLKINYCRSLRRLPNISSLKNLKVFNAEECWELRQIEGLSGLTSLEYLQLSGCNSLKESLGDLSNLNKLHVLDGAAECLDLTTDFSNFKNLKQLKINKSNRMEIQSLDGLEVLEELQICECSSIVRLPNLSYLNRLKTLTIMQCEQLIEIQSLDGLEALEDLKIYDCSSIVRLPNLSYLNRLKTLNIWSCKQLIEIPDLSELKSLENLKISGYRSVKALPYLSLLQKLKALSVSDCEELLEIRGIEELKSLERLSIGSGCSSVKALPDLSALQKLEALLVFFCVKLSEIRGIEELKSLERLSIRGCSSVTALPDLSALQNLKELDVSLCEKLSEIRGLEELKCLKELFIHGSKGLGHLRDLPNVKINR